MKLIRSSYQKNKEYYLDEDVDLSSFTFKQYYHINKIDSCHIKAKITNFESCLEVNLKLSGTVIACCSATLDLFPYKFEANDILAFGDDPDDEDIYFEGNTIDLDPYLLALIENAVPYNVKKPGAKLFKSGKGYEVLSEEEYIKEKEKKSDPRWADLDKLDI